MEPTRAGVETLGVLPDDDEVHVVLAVARHEGLDPGVAHDRAQVHVLIQAEPSLQQQVALEDARLHARVADRPEEHGVQLAELLQLLVGQHVAGAQVPLGAQVELDQLERGVALDGVEHLQALGDDLGPVPSPRITPIRWRRRRHGVSSFVALRIGDLQGSVHRGEVGARAGLHDVGGDAATGDPASVDLDLHDHVA